MLKQHNWFELLPLVIFGAEGEPEPKTGEQGQEETPKTEEEKPKEGTGSAAGGSEEDEEDDANDPKTAGLRSALRKERAERKAHEAELKELRKEREERELADKSEAEKEKIRADKATERVTKLATGLLNDKLDSAIRAAAKDFIDPTDAIAGVDREALVYEQDSDDPSKITIDAKSIERAVKAVATAKPHFLKTGTDDGEKTGSQFGGTKKTESTKADDLRALYPGLR